MLTPRRFLRSLAAVLHFRDWPVPRGWVPVKGELVDRADANVIIEVFRESGDEHLSHGRIATPRNPKAWEVQPGVATFKGWAWLPAWREAVRLVWWRAHTPHGLVGPYRFKRPLDFAAGTQPLFPPGTFIIDWTHGAKAGMAATAT